MIQVHLPLTAAWQKWRFSAPQTHLWLIKHLFSASTFVVKIATFAKCQTVMGSFFWFKKVINFHHCPPKHKTGLGELRKITPGKKDGAPSDPATWNWGCIYPEIMMFSNRFTSGGENPYKKSNSNQCIDKPFVWQMAGGLNKNRH